MHTPSFTHAGGIILRTERGIYEVLVVRPTRPGAAAWVLPKGHIEDGEDAEAAALREVREEAGGTCRNATYLGYTAFHTDSESVVCAFYSMELTTLDDPEEDRARAWLSLRELETAMPYEDTLALVRKAVAAGDTGN